MTRYELNGSFTTSTNIDLTNGDSILLDDTDTDNDNVSVSNILDPKHQQQQYGGSSFNQDDNDNNNDGGVHPSTNTVVLTKSNILIIESVAPHHQQQKNSSGSSAATPTAPSKKSKFSIRKRKRKIVWLCRRENKFSVIINMICNRIYIVSIILFIHSFKRKLVLIIRSTCADAFLPIIYRESRDMIHFSIVLYYHYIYSN